MPIKITELPKDLTVAGDIELSSAVEGTCFEELKCRI
jgi:hypothetical protein